MDNYSGYLLYGFSHTLKIDRILKIYVKISFSRLVRMSQEAEIALCPRILKSNFKNHRGKNATVVGKLMNIVEKDRQLVL